MNIDEYSALHVVAKGPLKEQFFYRIKNVVHSIFHFHVQIMLTTFEISYQNYSTFYSCIQKSCNAFFEVTLSSMTKYQVIKYIIYFIFFKFNIIRTVVLYNYKIFFVVQYIFLLYYNRESVHLILFYFYEKPNWVSNKAEKCL